ncbi:MAG TPA: glycosyltransferase family 1 protein [Spirochaetota bacterium]|nr:glycosyltransferase family 1 protein [Spirochaetota bacterium]
MKILYDHQIFSYQKFGGISRYHFELINHYKKLSEIDADIGLKWTDNFYLKNLNYKDVDENILSKANSNLKTLQRYNINKKESIKYLKGNDFNIFHPTFYDPYFLKYLRKKFVLTIYDMTPELFPDSFRNNWLYYRLVSKRWIDSKKELSKKSSIVFSISENTKNDIVKLYGIEPSKIKTIYLSHSIIIEKNININVPEKYILYVGARKGYKNFNFLLKVFKKISDRYKDISLICLGGGVFDNEENQLIESLNLQKKIFRFNANDNELFYYYNKALCFIYPSLYEGFGIPILESFASSCSVLLSNASCFPEIALDSGLYFDPLNEDSLYENVIRIINDKDLRKNYIERGLKRVKDFSWEKTANETLQVYKSLL